jgi:hypothetical protein
LIRGSGSTGEWRDLLAGLIGNAESVASQKQVPPLRIAIDEANRNAPVGMTI